MEVIVLGTNCAKCHRQYDNAKAAIEELGIDAKLSHLTEISEIMNYGVMSVPALVINGKVVSEGACLSTKQVMKKLS